MKRRDLLRAGLALPAVATGSISEAEARKRDVSGMNVVLFITDQQRAIQHFPRRWAEENLAGMQRLRRHGLTFENAFCSACMCSPSRASLLTGYFPAQHGVKYTLETPDPPVDEDEFPQVELPLDLPNIATVMGAAGYHVPYKGKWHLSKPPDGSDNFTPHDANKYGFARWDPPDAGANQDLDQFGGGDADNDGRFMEDDGPARRGREGVLAYLESKAAKQQPFFLIVSLVNPHDVLAYPRTYIDGGYDRRVLRGDIGLPQTVDEDLATKPSAQKEFLLLSAAALGPLLTDRQKTNYLNFYGNLMKEADAYLEAILDTLEEQDLLDDTLIIQTSDHGEMGMAHGGLRQKCFNFYEETLRVPLIFSNPRLYPRPRKTRALVSHVDFLPTLANLFDVPNSARADWQGVDYSKIVLRPNQRKRVQSDVVFTYDDFQVGQPTGPYVPQPNHIISIRERRYKLAKYYDPDGNEPDQWEMYDLKHDPLEQENIAYPDFNRTRQQERQLRRLKRKLAEVERTRLQPL